MMTHNGLFRNPMEFDMALQPAAFYMLRKGIRIDETVREKFREQFSTEITKFYGDLDRVIGAPLKAKKSISDDKVKKWLYGEMKIKPRTKNKKVTSDEDALRAIMAECAANLPKAKTAEKKTHLMRVFLALKIILQIKTREKLMSSYIQMEIDSDGRVRCSETVGGAETGRFAHSGTPWDTGTNLATIPRKLRTMFIADEGKELAEFDLNRGESWVYSFLSLDPELIRIHTTGGDFHSESASAISLAFGSKFYTVQEIIELNEVGSDFGYKIRYLGKKVNHASAYQMGPFRGCEVVNAEADDTGITVVPSQYKKAQTLWQQKYYMMPEWWKGIKKQIETTRKLETPFGRQRIFYDFLSESLFKEATAWVPQSTSVDYLNMGMLRVFNALVLTGKCELLHQNHDSILIQYPQGDRDEIIPQVMELLTSQLVINNCEFSIPVEGSYGQNWKELKTWKPTTN